MRFLIAISNDKRTKVIGHEGKTKLQFAIMITAILKECFRFLSKEELEVCLNIAEKQYEEDNK